MAKFAGGVGDVDWYPAPGSWTRGRGRPKTERILTEVERGSPALRSGPSRQSRLKILEVVEATFAGVGRHVSDLCAALLARGHEVHLAYSPVRIEDRFARAIAALADLRTFPVQLARAPAPSDVRAILELAPLHPGARSVRHRPRTQFQGGRHCPARRSRSMLFRARIYTPRFAHAGSRALPRRADAV